MKDLRDCNEWRRVVIEDIVFMQGDNFLQYEQYSPADDIEYLLQWYFPGEHMTGEYYARDINTSFLGRLIKIKGYKGYFLFSKNTSLGYIGLSRIVEFKKGL